SERKEMQSSGYQLTPTAWPGISSTDWVVGWDTIPFGIWSPFI
ncbi:hypothetical protein AVEN_253690-1, partial [Araneus ventricosus]